jgi:NADP-dependent 3-hydroxy acid dehydrogenase YdfG
MGFSTAKDFIKEGAVVIITGRSQETVDKALQHLGPNAKGFVSNAGKIADVFNLLQQVKVHTDRLDVLFVNAGYGKFRQ